MASPRTAPLPTTVAIQGEVGSNSAAAAQALLGDDVTLVCCDTFAHAFAALGDARAECAVLPVENTTVGLVQEVWDRLLGIEPAPVVWARAEARVRISFVIAALPGAARDVRRVLVHPVAAAQCRRVLTAAGYALVPCHDTAGAARMVHEGGDRATAALCPPSAVLTYGLEIVVDECGDAARTWTRFLWVERHARGEGSPAGDVSRAAVDDDRVLLAVHLPDRPGALARCIRALALEELNLCALHSRAVPGRAGVYVFLLEIEAGGRDPRVAVALTRAQSTGATLDVIGSFRAPGWPAAPATTSS